VLAGGTVPVGAKCSVAGCSADGTAESLVECCFGLTHTDFTDHVRVCDER
jgi:hypothetical protein